ncbi:MAG: Nicotinamide-nucleotide amidohydrolase PncC [Alphaproteobacteria bacterium MarineAlpha2_Bin1]|nr:MAG: Nicotinamide-nucleotide amidohydrolase PncC [Alphaproteobacteria bacterium MarineAlpha2_Bin1]
MKKIKERIYTAGLIIIGNEILSGRTEDKNISYVAKSLTQSGIRLNEVRVIGDIEEEIVISINNFRNRFDYVFTTGGIGPTHDDITTQSIAKAFGVKNILNPDAYKILLDYYGDRSKINESRMRMAYAPEGSELIYNDISKAPGFKKENVFILAGVPKIMMSMLDAVLPTLEKGRRLNSIELDAKVPEGVIAPELTAIQEKHEETDIGSYPYYENDKAGTVLVLRSTDMVALKKVEIEVLNLIKRFT